RPLRSQTEPQILRRVCVLIVVNEYVLELLVIFREHVMVLAEDTDWVEQQVAEVAGIQRLQPLLIGGIEFAALAIGKGTGIALRNITESEALVFPVVDHLRDRKSVV